MTITLDLGLPTDECVHLSPLGMYLLGIYHGVYWKSIPRRYILEGKYRGTHWGHGEGPSRCLEVRTVRARLDAAQHGPSAEGLPQMQESLLGHPAQDEEVVGSFRGAPGGARTRNPWRNPLDRRARVPVSPQGPVGYRGVGGQVRLPGADAHSLRPSLERVERIKGRLAERNPRCSRVQQQVAPRRDTRVRHLPRQVLLLLEHPWLTDDEAFQSRPRRVGGFLGLRQPTTGLKLVDYTANREPLSWIGPQDRTDRSLALWAFGGPLNSRKSLEVGEQPFQPGHDLQQRVEAPVGLLDGGNGRHVFGLHLGEHRKRRVSVHAQSIPAPRDNVYWCSRRMPPVVFVQRREFLCSRAFTCKALPRRHGALGSAPLHAQVCSNCFAMDTGSSGCSKQLRHEAGVVSLLCRACAVQRHGELSEDRQVGVQAHAVDATDAEREHSPLVLQASELALHGAALAVEGTVTLGVAWDEGVESVGFDPHGRGRALPGCDGSDVYVYLDCDGYLSCCACILQEREWVDDPTRPIIGGYLKAVGEIIDTRLMSTELMLAHLGRHRAAGHTVTEETISELRRDAAENDAWIIAYQAARTEEKP